MKAALLWTGVFVLLLGVNAAAQISLTGTNYSQNFDSMGTNGTVTPTGWFVGRGINANSGAVFSTNVDQIGTGSSAYESFR